MIVVGIAIWFNWDRQFQTALLQIFPDYGSGLTAVENNQLVEQALEERGKQADEPVMMQDQETTMNKNNLFSYADQSNDGVLNNHGKAPQIVTEGVWLNTEGPLSMEDLLGKVVLIDFWTYSCINCVRTIPYLKSWYNKYKDQGFVIIGIHTPEFEFEKNEDNVKQAMQDLGVDWPVVLDNEYRQWSAYSNRYWPAHYFIDVQGNIRYYHFGEGHYETSESVIRALLKEGGKGVAAVESITDPQNHSKTAETYLGYGREKGFVSPVSIVRDKTIDYRKIDNLKNGQWTLEGKWTVTEDYIVSEDTGTLLLGFHARNVYLVVEPVEENGNIIVRLDGKRVLATKDIKDGILVPDKSRLYELISLPESGPHILNLQINGRLRLFAFTFG